MRTKRVSNRKPWLMFRGLLVLLVVVLGLSAGMQTMAGNAPVPGHSNAFGQSLADWLETYWRWVYEGTPLPTDRYGNTVVRRVVLLAIPPTDGQGEPGFQDVTPSSGEAFVLPFFGGIGWQYPDGSFDPPIDITLFETLDITVKVDGVVVINHKNVMDYYAEDEFDPPIPYIPYPDDFPDFEVNLAFFQAVGMVHQPLSVGKHKVTLDASHYTQL